MKITGKFYRNGDTKIVRKFLIFPKTNYYDDGTKVTRWLEWADIKYHWIQDRIDGGSWYFLEFAD